MCRGPFYFFLGVPRRSQYPRDALQGGVGATCDKTETRHKKKIEGVHGYQYRCMCLHAAREYKWKGGGIKIYITLRDVLLIPEALYLYVAEHGQH